MRPFCLTCERDVRKGRRYCSRACYYESLRTGPAGVVRACQRCGFHFRSKPSASRKYCSVACYRLHALGRGRYEPCGRCGYDVRAIVLDYGNERLCPNCLASHLLDMTGRAPGLSTLMPVLEDALATGSGPRTS